MRKTNEMNLVTVTVNGVAITCTQEQAIAIASACAPTSVASSTRTRKQTAKTSTKSSKTTTTSTKTSKKSSKKQTAPKSQPKVVELANVVRNGKTVGFDKPVNKVVFKFHSELANGATYSTVNGCPTWTFTSEAKAKAFEKKAHAKLTKSEFAQACTHTERTDAEKQARKDAYDREWQKYVAKCEKDGIKRTSEMNKAENKRINAMLAHK